MANLDFSEFDSLFGDIGTVPTTPVQTNTTVEPVKAENIQVENVNAPLNPSVLQSGQVKMQQILVEMNNLFVERDELIKLMLLAVTTGTNLLMLGPPGTGKSMITYELCGRVDGANYFQWMLNKTSDPSEILGPFSVKEMENDKFMRITHGKLPEAHIAFMDEVNLGFLVA